MYPRTLFVTLVAALSQPISAQAQSERYDALANSPMAENRPTAETAKLLKDELLFQRAAQTYLWALPLINTLGMKVGSEKTFGAGYNVLPIWKKRLDAKTLVTTPNSDVIYSMSYLDLGTDGPMVFESPPELQGILLDFWQRPIPGPTIDGQAFFGDIGLPGPDRGEGVTPLSGGASYRLRLPPNIPAANFWSVTLYEAENASGLANGQPFPSLGSRDKPTQNPDGSTQSERPRGQGWQLARDRAGQGLLRHSAALQSNRSSDQ